MAARFEKVSRFKDIELPFPVRATGGAAGYDFFIAEDIVIPSFLYLQNRVENEGIMQYDVHRFDTLLLSEAASIIKTAGGKLPLVSTGMKCYLDEGTYLELSVRSSTPLKNWLILANGVGIVDRDYVNGDSEGEIFFQLINLSPWDIQLKKGDRIGQGIIKPYLTTEDDNCTSANRAGGFGSSYIKI